MVDSLYFSNSKTKENKEIESNKKQPINLNPEIKDNQNENENNKISQIPKQDKELVKKNEKDNEFTEKWTFDKEDINMSLNLIQTELADQQKEIEQFKTNLINKNFQSKKRTILSKVGFIMKSFVNITLSFLPLKLFKNKFVGTITSAIILNSRIKHLKRIMNNQENKIQLNNYEYILKEIKGKRDALLKTKEININSLNELDSIEKEIIIKYENELDNPEVIAVLANLNKTRAKILSYNLKIDKKIEKNKEIELEQKQKIKKLENM